VANFDLVPVGSIKSPHPPQIERRHTHRAWKFLLQIISQPFDHLLSIAFGFCASMMVLPM
jgi:hypothetical protein